MPQDTVPVNTEEFTNEDTKAFNNALIHEYPTYYPFLRGNKHWGYPHITYFFSKFEEIFVQSIKKDYYHRSWKYNTNTNYSKWYSEWIIKKIQEKIPNITTFGNFFHNTSKNKFFKEKKKDYYLGMVYVNSNNKIDIYYPSYPDLAQHLTGSKPSPVTPEKIRKTAYMCAMVAEPSRCRIVDTNSNVPEDKMRYINLVTMFLVLELQEYGKETLSQKIENLKEKSPDKFSDEKGKFLEKHKAVFEFFCNRKFADVFWLEDSSTLQVKDFIQHSNSEEDVCYRNSGLMPMSGTGAADAKRGLKRSLSDVDPQYEKNTLLKNDIVIKAYLVYRILIGKNLKQETEIEEFENMHAKIIGYIKGQKYIPGTDHNTFFS